MELNTDVITAIFRYSININKTKWILNYLLISKPINAIVSQLISELFAPYMFNEDLASFFQNTDRFTCEFILSYFKDVKKLRLDLNSAEKLRDQLHLFTSLDTISVRHPEIRHVHIPDNIAPNITSLEIYCHESVDNIYDLVNLKTLRVIGHGRGLKISPSVRELYVLDSKFSNLFSTQLVSLEAEINDEDITKLVNLRSLTIRNNSLNYWSQLTMLTSLNIVTGKCLRDDHLILLTNLKKLQICDCDNSELTLCMLTNLESLNIRYGIEFYDLSALRLTTVGIHECDVRLPVSVTSLKCQEDSVVNLSDLTSLTKLDIGLCFDENLRKLTNLTSLTAINDDSITDKSLSTLTNLRILNLEIHVHVAKYFKFEYTLPNLEYLRLGGYHGDIEALKERYPHCLVTRIVW